MCVGEEERERESNVEMSAAINNIHCVRVEICCVTMHRQLGLSVLSFPGRGGGGSGWGRGVGAESPSIKRVQKKKCACFLTKRDGADKYKS